MRTLQRCQYIAVVRYIVVILVLTHAQAFAQVGEGDLFNARARTVPGPPADIDLGLEDATAIALLPLELQDCSAFGTTCTADAGAGAHASRGALRMSADADILNMGASVGELAAFASASFAGEDVIFGAPDAMISTSMTVILNGQMKGTWEGSGTPGVASFNRARASVGFELTIFDGGVPIVARSHTLEVTWDPAQPSSLGLGGIGSPLLVPLARSLTPLDCDGLHLCIFTTNFFHAPVVLAGLSVPTGRPLILILSMAVSVRNRTSPLPATSHLTVEANFTNSLELPTDRPVFELPPGFTVNSAQLNIVNNQYLGQENCALPGDVNLDGQITPADALMAFQGFLDIIQLHSCGLAHANLLLPDNSGITPGDALCVLQQFLGEQSCVVTAAAR